MTSAARRRLFALIAVVTLAAVVLTPGSVPGPVPHAAAQAGSVEAVAFSCPATVDPTSNDPAVFAEACVEPVNGLIFSLTAGGVTRRRTTAEEEPVSWSAVSGPFTMRLEDPRAEQAVAFCATGADARRALVEDGAIEGEVAEGAGLICQWYIVPEAALATATTTAPPTATAAPSPTATQAPTATAAATATPAPTATPTPPPLDLSGPGNLTMFRGDPAHTGASEETGPDSQPALLWRYPLGRRVLSSPAVANDTVYVGGDDALFALDAETGTERWRVPLTGPVIGSPAVLDTVVFAGSEGGELVAVDGATGTVYWRFAAEGKIRASPAVVDGVVYVTSYDGNAYAIDGETGAEIWRVTTAGDLLLSSPAVADGVVYFGTADITAGEVYALDAATGDQRWRIDLSGPVISSPTVVGETVFLGSYDGRFYALNTANGDRRWQVSTGRPIWSSPAVVDGVVYVGSRDHAVHAFDAVSGMERWEFPTGDWVDSSPTVAGGVVYVASKDRNLYALNAETGESVWQIEAAGSGGYISSSPVVADGVVYVTSRDGFIYAYGGGQIEATGDLPADVPREIVTESGRYLFDRLLFADAGAMTPAGAVGPIRFYTQEEPTPDAPLYAVVPGRADGELVRYLPERLDAPDDPCPGEDPSVLPLQSGDIGYAYAGLETVVTTASLTAVATTNDGREIYSATESPPFEELFVEAETGLQRFLLLDERGLPAMLRGTFPFAGSAYVFAGDATGTADPTGLTRVGCAGPFSVMTAPDAAEAPFGRIFIAVGGPNDLVLEFEGV